MSDQKDDIPKEAVVGTHYLSGPIDGKGDTSVKDVSVQIGKTDEHKEQDEEAKESEKPLLHDEDGKSDVVITVSEQKEDEGGVKIIGQPTLPLPVGWKKKEADDDRIEESQAPSIFTSPYARLKYDWEKSSSLLEFLVRVVCVIFASIGWIVLVGGLPFMSIVQIVIGSIYLHDCTAEPRIPEYLLVAGIFGTILHGVSVVTKYTPKQAKKLVHPHRRRCLCIETLLQIFLFVWFIAGCTWVYAIYEPVYDHEEHEDYCHKGLYLFTFWLFNLTFIILTIILCVGICAIAFVAFGKSPTNESEA